MSLLSLRNSIALSIIAGAFAVLFVAPSAHAQTSLADTIADLLRQVAVLQERVKQLQEQDTDFKQDRVTYFKVPGSVTLKEGATAQARGSSDILFSLIESTDQRRIEDMVIIPQVRITLSRPCNENLSCPAVMTEHTIREGESMKFSGGDGDTYVITVRTAQDTSATFRVSKYDVDDEDDNTKDEDDTDEEGADDGKDTDEDADDFNDPTVYFSIPGSVTLKEGQTAQTKSAKTFFFTLMKYYPSVVSEDVVSVPQARIGTSKYCPGGLACPAVVPEYTIRSGEAIEVKDSIGNLYRITFTSSTNNSVTFKVVQVSSVLNADSLLNDGRVKGVSTSVSSRDNAAVIAELSQKVAELQQLVSLLRERLSQIQEETNEEAEGVIVQTGVTYPPAPTVDFEIPGSFSLRSGTAALSTSGRQPLYVVLRSLQRERNSSRSETQACIGISSYCVPGNTCTDEDIPEFLIGEGEAATAYDARGYAYSVNLDDVATSTVRFSVGVSVSPYKNTTYTTDPDSLINRPDQPRRCSGS